MTMAQKQRIDFLRGRGDSYAVIADALGISENTVKSYCRRNKLNVTIQQEKSTVPDVCENCGSPLTRTPGAKRKRFCSYSCRMAWWASHPEAVNRKAVYQFVCPVCGTDFTAYGDANRKYCSRACASTARRTCHE